MILALLIKCYTRKTPATSILNSDRLVILFSSLFRPFWNPFCGRLSTTRNALLKPIYTDSETINPYLPSGIHLSFKGCQVSCVIVILFRKRFPVSKQCKLWSDAEFGGVLIWVCSGSALVPYAPVYGAPDAYWLIQRFTMGDHTFYCISRKSPGMFFPRVSSNQIHLSYIYSDFCNVRRNKVSEFTYIRLVSSRGYKASPTMHPLGMHLVVRSHVLRTMVYHIFPVWYRQDRLARIRTTYPKSRITLKIAKTHISPRAKNPYHPYHTPRDPYQP